MRLLVAVPFAFYCTIKVATILLTELYDKYLHPQVIESDELCVYLSLCLGISDLLEARHFIVWKSSEEAKQFESAIFSPLF